LLVSDGPMTSSDLCWRSFDFELFLPARRSPDTRTQFPVAGRRRRRCRSSDEEFLAEAPRRRSERDWPQHHTRRHPAHDRRRAPAHAGDLVRRESNCRGLDHEAVSDPGFYVRTNDAWLELSARDRSNEAEHHARAGEGSASVARPKLSNTVLEQD